MGSATCNYAGNRAKASELLHWINACVGTTYGKVDDLSSGAAYSQFTDMVLAGALCGSCPSHKVNLRAKKVCESIHNFEVLREAFERVGVDREVPVERLAERSYRDNFRAGKVVKRPIRRPLPGYRCRTAGIRLSHASHLSHIGTVRIPRPPCSTYAMPRTTTRIARLVQDPITTVHVPRARAEGGDGPSRRCKRQGLLRRS